MRRNKSQMHPGNQTNKHFRKDIVYENDMVPVKQGGLGVAWMSFPNRPLTRNTDNNVKVA